MLLIPFIRSGQGYPTILLFTVQKRNAVVRGIIAGDVTQKLADTTSFYLSSGVKPIYAYVGSLVARSEELVRGKRQTLSAWGLYIEVVISYQIVYPAEIKNYSKE